jgi:3-phenylpropionate/trans-cinnamate dioxygenase ferredoxin reductase subunit
MSRGYDQVVIRGSLENRSFACLYLRDRELIAVDAVNAPKDFVQSKPLIAAHAKIDPDILGDANIPLKDMV